MLVILGSFVIRDMSGTKRVQAIRAGRIKVDGIWIWSLCTGGTRLHALQKEALERAFQCLLPDRRCFLEYQSALQALLKCHPK